MKKVIDMGTLQKELVAAAFVKINNANTEDTEEDLNMYISEKIIERKFDKRFKDGIQILNVKQDDFKNVPNGAWVYSMSDSDWVFERYDSIGEAVKRAINIVDSMVICNGKEIAFDAFDDKHAYYINEAGDAIMVAL